jgi:hypothetical protein
MPDKTSVLVAVVLGATLSTARAQPEPEPEPDAEADSAPAPQAAPADAAGVDQLTLPKGRLLLDAFVEINLSTDAVFKPFSITPDVWYGVTDDITVGLVHSSLATTGFIGNAGDSLCLASTSDGCPDVYRNVGVDVRYKLKSGPLAYAVDGGLFARSLDPFALALKAGVSGRWSSGKLAVEAQPNLIVGVTERTQGEGMLEVTTNGEVLNVPVTGFYAVDPRIAVSLQLGFVIPFEETGDAFTVPLSIGGHYHLNESLNLTAAFSLPRLVAGTAPDTFDARSLTLGGTYAF